MTPGQPGQSELTQAIRESGGLKPQGKPLLCILMFLASLSYCWNVCSRDPSSALWLSGLKAIIVSSLATILFLYLISQILIQSCGNHLANLCLATPTTDPSV